MKDPFSKPRAGRVQRLCYLIETEHISKMIDGPPVRPYRQPDTTTPTNDLRESIRKQCKVALDYVRGLE